jgi:hypothetical protein
MTSEPECYVLEYIQNPASNHDRLAKLYEAASFTTVDVCGWKEGFSSFKVYRTAILNREWHMPQNTALAVNIRLTFAHYRLNLASVGFSTPLREERMRQARAGG